MKSSNILVFSDYYKPGFKTGGPVRSLSNLLEACRADYNFILVTRDRDIGDVKAYSPDVKLSYNNRVKKIYLSPKELKISRILNIIKESDCAIVYLNSFFSFWFSVIPLCLIRFVLRKQVPVIIAPRGEFSPGALAIKRLKKSLFLFFVKLLGSHKKIVWHAITELEKKHIQKVFGKTIQIRLAPNLVSLKSEISICVGQQDKQKGSGKFLYISRIVPKKNLLSILKYLNNLEGDIVLDIYGNIEDERYWVKCQKKIAVLPKNIKVNYFGALDPTKLAGVIVKYDAFVLPTFGENFGHIILEVLSCACPVVISDQTPWITIEDEHAGWIVSLKDKKRWKEVLQKIINMSNTELESYKKASKICVGRRCDNDTAIRLTKELFSF